MHLTRRIAVVIAASAVLSAGVSACGGSSSSSGSSGTSSGGHSIVDKAKNDKTLTIGVKPDQPGLGLQDSAGQYTGFDIDVATYIAKKLGATKINWVPTLSANREAFLQQGKVDLVVATYSVTAKRQKIVSFAGPYYVAHQDILVRAGDNSIRSADDLKGKKVCSGQGSASGDRIEALYGSKVNLIRLPGYGDCVNQLLGGQVEAVTTDNTILAGFAAQPQNKGKLKVVGTFFSNEIYGVGLKKGDTQGVQAVDKALQDMFSDGSWKAALASDLPQVPAGTPPTIGQFDIPFTGPAAA
jgi:glutamate transport system substrate-binding protein